jgi:hypothetical protein
VKIYGHYPAIDGKDRHCYYRHPIHELSFAVLEEMEKWRTAYRFTKSVYDIYSIFSY